MKYTVNGQDDKKIIRIKNSKISLPLARCMRRLKKNILAMGGLILIVIIAFLAIFGPLVLRKIAISDQKLELGIFHQD